MSRLHVTDSNKNGRKKTCWFLICFTFFDLLSEFANLEVNRCFCCSMMWEERTGKTETSLSESWSQVYELTIMKSSFTKRSLMMDIISHIEHRLGCPPSQDSSHHQDYEPFLVGNPNLNLHLPLASWEGGQPPQHRQLSIQWDLMTHYISWPSGQLPS